ncbi:MAG: MATE family efflux transporter [Sedimentisphaerales bacterium]|nr:MATE family efflux transporter [Sedimentisphaerales bacterium]
MTDKSTLLPQTSLQDETSLKYMLKLAAPMVVAHISFTIMQFVDRIMVSRLGTDALAAILPAGYVGFLPAAFAIGVMTSVNTFVSQSLGRGDRKACSNYCWQAIYMGLVYSVVVATIMWPTAPAIFKMLGHDSAVAAMEVIYLRITLYVQILAVFVWASSQFFMGVHRPVVMMYSAIAGQVVNVAANYVLIFGKFGFPAMGIAGAGWGTFIGIAAGSAIRMAVFLFGDINTSFKSRHSLNVDFGKMADLLKVGFPAGIGLMVNIALWGVILFGMVGRFGKNALAATSAVLSCVNVSVMPVLGLGTALTAAVGKSIGQGKKDVAIKQTSVCLRIGLVYMGLIGLCLLLFRNSIMAFWSTDDTVISIGTRILVIAAIYQVFDAATLIYNGSLRGAGDTLWLAMVSAFGVIVVLGAGSFFIIKLFPGLGALGPWSAAMLSIITIGLANRWRFKSNRWMRIDLFKRHGAEIPIGDGAAVE